MNILLIVLLVLLVWRTIAGVQKGIVRETISFINILFAAATLGLACMAVNAYKEAYYLQMFIFALIIVILGVIHSVLRLVFFSAKVVSKLPVISSADRLAGLVMGVVETLILYWILCYILIYFDFGALRNQLMLMITENKILSFLYQYNLLGLLLETIKAQIAKAAAGI